MNDFINPFDDCKNCIHGEINHAKPKSSNTSHIYFKCVIKAIFTVDKCPYFKFRGSEKRINEEFKELRII